MDEAALRPQFQSVSSRTALRTWLLVTGQYPPETGGVGDYTELLAHELAAEGDEVHLFTPGYVDAGTASGPEIHPLPGHFGPAALRELGRALDQFDPAVPLLVQYTPQAYGARSMNVAFCAWLCRLQRPLWIMFHEVAFPLGWRQRPQHNLLGATHRLMARLAALRAERIFVSIPAWGATLQQLGVHTPAEWLPVPSNLPTSVTAWATAAVRDRFAPESGAGMIGHFGTYGGAIGTLLHLVLPALLSTDRRRQAVLIGRGSEAWAAELVYRHPELQGHVHATGALPAAEVPAHLAACDLLLQPYPDGVSTRRGSAMAGLALGVPLVTTHGPLTEPVWRESGAVALAATGTELVQLAERLLADPDQRRTLGGKGRALYETRFSLAHTVRALRGVRA